MVQPYQAIAREQVDMELMTYLEVDEAMQKGKTTVLIYNGGTEQRGPHAVLGGHTFIVRRASVAIAQQLGNALVAPILPFSPAENFLNPRWPGTVNLPGWVFSAVNEAVVDSMVVNGFKNIVLLGDHGGGQMELQKLATQLNKKYALTDSCIFFCGDVYAKTALDVRALMRQNNLPQGAHGGVHDTSTLMFLGGDLYIRKDKLVAGNPEPGHQVEPNKPMIDDNGINGDPRPSTQELGKMFFDIKVRNAVAQIRSLIGSAAKWA